MKNKMPVRKNKADKILRLGDFLLFAGKYDTIAIVYDKGAGEDEPFCKATGTNC